MKTTQIIWNGCDGYTEVSRLRAPDDRVEVAKDGSATLWTTRESFRSFPAVEISIDDVPMVDGEHDFDGLFVTDSEKIYRAA